MSATGEGELPQQFRGQMGEASPLGPRCAAGPVVATSVAGPGSTADVAMAMHHSPADCESSSAWPPRTQALLPRAGSRGLSSRLCAYQRPLPRTWR
jgi:hypothetical protein